VADWIKVMAPKGFELLMPDDVADSPPTVVTEELVKPEST
jgi:hypothetical protein